MVRGIHRSVIQIKAPTNSPFDEAYLILRAGAEQSAVSDKDMTKEANRLLESSGLTQSPLRSGKKRTSSKKVFPFFCGLLCGASLVALIWLFVLLFL